VPPTLAVLVSLVSTATPGAAVDFPKDVAPIFESRCVKCHGERKQKGDLRLDRRTAVLERDPELGAVVVPGKPEESELVRRVSLPPDDPDVMPAEGEPLTTAEIETIRAWIGEGAAWPEDPVSTSAAGGPAPAAELETLKPDVPLAFAPLDADRAAALERAVDAIRARGGSVTRVAENTEAIDVNLGVLGSAATDADLALLAGLEPRLVRLDLSRTGLTDEGVAAALGRFDEIRRLSVADTKAGDRALAAIAGLPRIEWLNLFGSAVTDAGLERLASAKHLRRLFLWKTAVTDAGVGRLEAAIPGISIERGGYAEAMARAAEEERALAKASEPSNALCPVSGKPVQPGFALKHGEKTIGFCCGTCLEKFKAQPDAFPAITD